MRPQPTSLQNFATELLPAVRVWKPSVSNVSPNDHNHLPVFSRMLTTPVLIPTRSWREERCFYITQRPSTFPENINMYFIFIFKKFIYFCLSWVFVAARRLSLVVVSRGYSSLWCTGFSLRWLLLLWTMGSRRAGFSSCDTQASVVVARGL